MISPKPVSRRRFVLGAALAGAAGVGGTLVGRSTALAQQPSPDATGSDEIVEIPNDADFGFLIDMTAHHVQALDLCQRVIGSDTGDPVQAAAAEVLQTQAMEVGQMRAWLTDWGQSTAPPETVMMWMHDGQMCMPLGMMPGYATSAELQALSLADGLAKGRMFLELMHAHHVGGVAMAEAATMLAATTKVRRLAQAQAQVQTFEIAQYDLLLSTTYAAAV